MGALRSNRRLRSADEDTTRIRKMLARAKLHPLARPLVRQSNWFNQRGYTKHALLATGLLVLVTLTAFFAWRSNTLKQTDSDALANASQFLSEGHFSTRGPRVFFGQLNPRWRTLTEEEQRAETEKIRKWLMYEGVTTGVVRVDNVMVIDFKDGKARFIRIGDP